MYHHLHLGETTDDIKRKLNSLIRSGEITLGGYKKAKIYGRLNCSSGKRMKIENRVFFKDIGEAISHGYRPCGHCLPEAYRIWKAGKV
ncbi:methylphosphotriester-DNA--protein-cysteine methyltransferase [Pedobacter africanus]|uniref:Methylphosphotriester-DNA--protein-cysteine methyltransferase n=1 Tax=Pedobacter africanus TaxID=151894 RepID=A0ACC6KR87_9SPHI|nr:Ada metal-binding domain-containing protein [Pedobacter africanus]MDR6781870.1 methylphosphotriester-DNA--protein-cysteine methyltransferase [Pedobacter africanus]